jgi:hypothetical protein
MQQDFGQYLRDIRDVLSAGDVRPHIKELGVALVTWVSDPVLEEWQALRELGDVAVNPLAQRAHSLAAQAPAFSTLLLTEGIVAGYLSNPATADLGARLCQLLVRAHPRRSLRPACALCRPTGVARAAGPRREYRAAARQRAGVDLMEAVIDAGDVDDAIRGPAVNSDFFSLLQT